MQYVAGGTLHDVIERAQEISQDERDGSIAADSIQSALDGSGGFATPDASALRTLR